MKRWPQLDGLRGIAVLAVVAYHASPHGFLRGGFLGVDLFFVLSGFLITSLLAVEFNQFDSVDLKRFFWNRALRLTPPLLLMISAYVLIAPLIWPAYPHGRDALAAATYVSNFTKASFDFPNYLSHTWSLSVEEQYYLIWPAILILLHRTRNPVLWLGVAYIAATFWRHAFLYDFALYYHRLDTRSSGLILGGLLYYAQPRLKLGTGTAVAAFLVLGTLFLISVRQASYLYMPLAELASAALIICVVTNKSGPLDRILRNPALCAVGTLSYGIYLWHYPIARALRGTFDGVTIFAVTLSASFVAAAVSYKTVEAGVRRLRIERDRSTDGVLT